MNLTLSPKVTLRDWTLDDVEFSLRVRNHPELMKYFRQNKPLTLDEQSQFIRQDTGYHGTYNGKIVECDGQKVGLCSIKSTGEFTIALLPQYQKQGIAKETMRQLTSSWAHAIDGPIWSEVFVGNPALEFFISKCGFKVYGVKERAYYKPEFGLVGVVKILHK